MKQMFMLYRFAKGAYGFQLLKSASFVYNANLTHLTNIQEQF